jgi:hypothetical protein
VDPTDAGAEFQQGGHSVSMYAAEP